MSNIIQDIKEYQKKEKKRARLNDNLQIIWNKIDGNIIYYVDIGISGEMPFAKIEDREGKGIAYKKVMNSIIFTHGKTKIEISIPEDAKIDSYPGGSQNIPDCLGISFHTHDWQNSASIEYSAGKTNEYNTRLRKRLKKDDERREKEMEKKRLKKGS